MLEFFFEVVICSGLQAIPDEASARGWRVVPGTRAQ